MHSGAPVCLVLHPAEADTGFRFLVTKRGRIIADIPAHIDSVKNLTLCTVLGDDTGVTVGTVEHLLSALRGLNVDNCFIEIDAREVPIMDGSAATFVSAIDQTGIRELAQPRKFIKVLKPVRVEEGDCWGMLTPHSSFHVDVEIDFPTALIGRQRMGLEMNAGAFRNEICRARTFGFMRDVESLWKAGLALGASLENTVALADDRIVNSEGLRYPQEFVRHKILDAVGDLALAGARCLRPIDRSRAVTGSTLASCRPCLRTAMPGRSCVHLGCARSFPSRFRAAWPLSITRPIAPEAARPGAWGAGGHGRQAEGLSTIWRQSRGKLEPAVREGRAGCRVVCYGREYRPDWLSKSKTGGRTGRHNGDWRNGRRSGSNTVARQSLPLLALALALTAAACGLRLHQ